MNNVLLVDALLKIASLVARSCCGGGAHQHQHQQHHRYPVGMIQDQYQPRCCSSNPCYCQCYMQTSNRHLHSPGLALSRGRYGLFTFFPFRHCDANSCLGTRCFQPFAFLRFTPIILSIFLSLPSLRRLC